MTAQTCREWSFARSRLPTHTKWKNCRFRTVCTQRYLQSTIGTARAAESKASWASTRCRMGSRPSLPDPDSAACSGSDDVYCSRSWYLARRFRRTVRCRVFIQRALSLPNRPINKAPMSGAAGADADGQNDQRSGKRNDRRQSEDNK